MAVPIQVTRAPATGNRFAGETAQQIAKRREIARRHCRRRNDAAFMPSLRIGELQRIFADQYGARCLPNDDAGRADLRLMADHLAQIDPRSIRPWAAAWMPTLTPAELDALIAEVGTGRRWKADALARELGIDDATRTRLKIRTIGAIDCTKAKRMTRRRRKRIAADRARRAKAGARPRAQSAAATMPWLDEGISRATYYRRRAQKIAALETVETETRPIVRSTSIAKNRRDKVATAVAHDVQTCPAKPLPFCFRVRQLCDQDRIAEAMGRENVARARLRAVASAVSRSPEPERWQHLIVAASGAWARAKAGRERRDGRGWMNASLV